MNGSFPLWLGRERPVIPHHKMLTRLFICYPQESRKQVALLQARAAAAGALSPTRGRAATNGSVASLTQQLAAADRKAAAFEAQLSRSRAQAEETGSLVGALEAELETVKAQVEPQPRAQAMIQGLGCTLTPNRT